MKKQVYVGCKYDANIGWDNDEGTGEAYSGYNHEVRSNHRFNYGTNFSYDYEPVPTVDVLDENINFLVYTLYSDGGTFGRVDGYVYYHKIFADAKEANALVNEVNDRNSKFNKSDNYEYPWIGYFASRDVTEIATLIGRPY